MISQNTNLMILQIKEPFENAHSIKNQGLLVSLSIHINFAP
jgi:hypothetical protein